MYLWIFIINLSFFLRIMFWKCREVAKPKQWATFANNSPSLLPRDFFFNTAGNFKPWNFHIIGQIHIEMSQKVPSFGTASFWHHKFAYSYTRFKVFYTSLIADLLTKVVLWPAAATRWMNFLLPFQDRMSESLNFYCAGNICRGSSWSISCLA